MVQRIHVDTFLKQLGEGTSDPLLVLGSDQERYILKNQRIMDQGTLKVWDCMFLNELLTNQIAVYLGVPVPQVAAAELDKRILENGPSLRFVHRFTEGIHFASKEIPEKEDNLVENFELLRAEGKPYFSRTWNSFFSNIVNREDISRIIAFDIFVANYDRYNNEGNLLVAHTDQGRMVFSIDHGHAFFGPVWETGRMATLRSVSNSPDFVNTFVGGMHNPARGGWLNGMGRVFRAVEEVIDLTNPANHPFQSVVYEIENITEAMLDSWFSEIPDEWFVDKTNQIGIMKHFLMHQRHNVRHIIQQMAFREAFTNYRGGVLGWRDLRAGIL